MRFNGTISLKNLDDQVCGLITSGFLNRKDYRDPKLRKELEKKLAQFKWVLVDEVSYTINAGGCWIFDHLINSEASYSFDATSDRIGGKMISFANGIDDTVMDNKELVSIFGPSLVYRMPATSEIDYITIRSHSIDKIEFTEEDFNAEGNVYHEIMSKIWTDPGICNLIVKLVKRYPRFFIPINDLNNIIYNWINNYFIPNHLRILLICYEGYIYYDKDGNQTKMDLMKACEVVESERTDVIVGTSSAYRALSIQKMENMLLTTTVNAGTTLQSLGRCARNKHFRVFSIESKTEKRLPIHTRNSMKRYEMIHDYYKYSQITDIFMDENEL